MKKEETVDFNIKTTWLAISRMYNQKAQVHGFTMSVGFVLLNINPDLGTRATSIAPLVGLEVTSLTRMLKTLEEQGLIERRSDPEDGRAVRIFLTEKGHFGREIAKGAVINFNESVKSTVSNEELTVFFKVMKKINETLEKVT
ncbi:MAG: MarR family transcriptional regulator [Cyclobacteriaceae bacterium]|nr:MarR family transcriptional regulator [Cyclobacteriaceae bacterium]